MELSIQFMAGLCLSLLGLSYLLATRDWIIWLENVERQGRKASLSIGSIGLIISSFILAFHWVWQGWLTLLTLIGVIALMESILYLIFPGCLSSILAKMHSRLTLWIKISGALFTFIGIILLYSWGQQLGYWEMIGGAEGVSYDY